MAAPHCSLTKKNQLLYSSYAYTPALLMWIGLAYYRMGQDARYKRFPFYTWSAWVSILMVIITAILLGFNLYYYFTIYRNASASPGTMFVSTIESVKTFWLNNSLAINMAGLSGVYFIYYLVGRRVGKYATRGQVRKRYRDNIKQLDDNPAKRGMSRYRNRAKRKTLFGRYNNDGMNPTQKKPKGCDNAQKNFIKARHRYKDLSCQGKDTKRAESNVISACKTMYSRCKNKKVAAQMRSMLGSNRSFAEKLNMCTIVPRSNGMSMPEPRSCSQPRRPSRAGSRSSLRRRPSRAGSRSSRSRRP